MDAVVRGLSLDVVDAQSPVASLSGGNKTRVSLARLLLDEPTSHLDLAALEAMEEALASYTGPLLLISHDRYFVERAGITRVEVMQEGTLSSADSVDEYERRMMSGEVASGS
ncbi:MAG: hypothetical protein PVSMB7_20890 [Chloroflexota bacterium]